jgi:hypothetical protein
VQVIDGLTQLAFAICSKPGAYAFLLGSGVSRSAGVKTGWEIVLDLIAQVAAVKGEDAGSDPARWYREHGSEPDYATLLELLARTPAQRQAILRRYFEPTDDERSQGLKGPTPAHRALAALVAAGYVRVVVTTNFDRLLEDAMADAGVRPYVVRGGPDVEGMGPPAQHDAVIIKLHGDYLDARIRNTPEELASYEPELDRLLDRVLEDYGLVVLGWSGEWDAALRDAMRRARSSRLPWFWASMGEPSGPAAELVANRGAVAIPTQGADAFLPEVLSRVEALADLRERPPLTVDLAIAQVKRLLADPAGRIRLRDLVVRETEAALAVLAGVGGDGGPGTAEEVDRRLRVLGEGAARLAAIAAVICFWGDGPEVGVVCEALARLGRRGYDQGNSWLWPLRGYPATLAMYAALTAAIAASRYDNVRDLLRTPVGTRDDRWSAARALVNCNSIDFNAANAVLQLRHGRPETRWFAPQSELMREPLRAATEDALPDDSQFLAVYLRAEALVALVSAMDAESGFGLWFPPGLYRHYEHEAGLPGGGILGVFLTEMERQGDAWGPVATGLFPSEKRVRELIEACRMQPRY